MAARTYQLIVEGELGHQLEPAFGTMTLTRGVNTTTLTGELRDQSELQGVLQRVSDLGLVLLEARAIDDRPDRDPGQEPPVHAGQRPAPVPESSRERS